LRNSAGSPEYFNPPPEEYLSWEVDIPLPIGGKIIGRAGKNVKELRDKTGCKVIIKDLENNRRRQLLIVRGTFEQIGKCQNLLQKKFKKDIEFDNGVFYTMDGMPGIVGYPMLPSPPLPQQAPIVPANTYLQLPQCAYFDVLVCSIQTAGHFFLQQPTHSSYFNLNRLNRCMEACYGPNVPELPSPIALGTICAALLDGESWCRAQVVFVAPDESTLTVRCLDVGGYREMARSDVKQIRTDFLSLPFQATEVFLSEITPTNNEEDFSDEATKFLDDLLSTCGTPQAYLKGWNSNDMPLVDLIIRRDAKFVSVAQLLIDNGYAVALEMLVM
jgi:A-kinase anchor protein 1